ncbi:hypothetical protein UFOVP207_6 [uncultured Caudovirales phage]|uniref:Uncharacterized protein n=1 Tax=uncultured Caudovirales phage TaxID=2100421 RepID=A0A6J7WLS5_9CAUD|nr:hypothetical protein UFOVP207_6 [uncultured Caudovirales phage]
MILLQPISTSQTFVVAQRKIGASETRANKIKIIDEETNTSRVINLTGTTEGDYSDTVTITISPALKEGHTYRAIMYVNSEVYTNYRGKIFCTSQIDTSKGFFDVRDYSVNHNRYTQNTTTNEFILNE